MHMTRQRIIRFILILLVLALPVEALGQVDNSLVPKMPEDEILSVDIAEVVSDPKQYDGIKVTLEGKVKKVKYTKSSKGEDFTVFELRDPEGNKVGVYYEDEHLPIEKGDTVRIMGKFRKQKKYFLYKVKNVIKARTVETVAADPPE